MALPHNLDEMRPDLLWNDPATSYTSGQGRNHNSSSGAGAGAASTEMETCRICRCEGTASEPLFYPCKCSGSIKFVHQNCLMEWLSHSQKKYCELCKTPFRFTKLYNPDMPRAVPLLTFSKHAVICLAHNALVWMRAALVASVWLCWLPYLMRRLWTMLFWISDDGLDGIFASPSNFGSVNANEIAVLQGYATSPSSPLTALRYCPPISQLSPAVYDQIVMATDLSGTHSARTYTLTERIIIWFVRFLFPAPRTRAEMAAMTLGAFGTPGQKHTLFGNVRWLRNLTSYPHLNNAIITVLEGQFITVVVVVCFILVILVRDYVVQHQPDLNGRDGGIPVGVPLNPANDRDFEQEALAEDRDLDLELELAAFEQVPPLLLNLEEERRIPLEPALDAFRRDIEMIFLLSTQDLYQGSLSSTLYRGPDAVRLALACMKLTSFDEKADLVQKHTLINYRPSDIDDLDNFLRLLAINESNIGVLWTNMQHERASKWESTLYDAVQEYVATHPNPEDYQIRFQEPMSPKASNGASSSQYAAFNSLDNVIASSSTPETDKTTREMAPGHLNDAAPRHSLRSSLEEFDNDNAGEGPSNFSAHTGNGASVVDKGKTPVRPNEIPQSSTPFGELDLNSPSFMGSAYTRPRSQSDGPTLRSSSSFLANDNWVAEPFGTRHEQSESTAREDDTVPASNNPDIAQAAGWSFTALESQPLFSRTRDEEGAPFLDSSPTNPNSVYSNNIGSSSNHHSRVASGTYIDAEYNASNHDSDWESLPDEPDQEHDHEALFRFSVEDLFNGQMQGFEGARLYPTDEERNHNERHEYLNEQHNHYGHYDERHEQHDEDDHDEQHRQPRYRFVEPADEVLHVEDADIEHQEDHTNQVEDRPQDEVEAFDIAGFEAHAPNANEHEAEWDDEVVSDESDEELDENDAEAAPHHVNVRRQRRRNRQRNEEQEQRRVANLPGIMAQFMWGGIADEPDDDVAAEADANADGANDAGEDDRWLDIRFDDGVDDGFDNEEFEGMMELIGMGGPIFGLFQNAMFCICLVLISLILCVVFPYNIGRMTAWFVANPLRILRLMFAFVSLIQDLVAFVCGMSVYILSFPMFYIGKLAGWEKTSRDVARVLGNSLQLSSDAMGRLGGMFLNEMVMPTEFRSFSMISHASVNTIKHALASSVAFVFISMYKIVTLFLQSLDLLAYPLRWNIPFAWASVANCFSLTIQAVKKVNTADVVARLKNPNTWVISINTTEDYSNLDVNLMYWSGWDRAFVILMGYATLTAMAALYLKRTRVGAGILGLEAHVALVAGLVQAGGVMKVLLIISIEMLLFPLYCGILMDIALLPLFESATLASRFEFAMKNPLTSMFVHWFVGTGYMFHFALFVSMCRKIMRKGVLYFIRDPDDPDFHPIREVLERKFLTQVRKIMFSALVYGTLVIVCLGSVVWGLSYNMPSLFPIHYSSNEPVLEFPIDLLFYNFLMPLAVKFFKPGDGIQAMYKWCFRRSARMLRLTCYMFNERELDEEGDLVGTDGKLMPWYTRAFMEYRIGSGFQSVPLTKFFGSVENARPYYAYEKDQMKLLKTIKENLVEKGQLVPTGRFVYAPASDQVRIVRGERVFIPMKERRLVKGSAPANFTPVYLPPDFYTRVGAFVLCLWLFAAVTGVTLTVIPLAVGRYIFTALLPDHVRTNDIYAFTIGIYVMASVGWLAVRVKEWQVYMQRSWSWLARVFMHPESASRWAALIVKAIKVVYTYTIMILVFPILTAMLVELYVLVPLHSYFYPSPDPANRHVIPIIQTWTLGILYLKLGSRIVSRRYANSRFRRAMRAVTRRGILNPRVGLFTRAFVVPGLVLSLVAIVAPPALMDFTIATNVLAPMSDSAAMRALMYRMSYPLTALWVGLLLGLNAFFGVATAWSNRIRDEAYLIGTRLHNFGEAKAGRGAGRREGAV
ncbi:hypothetical protein TD95_002316 [Thielaviopsis punctulata]|uniref:RING-type E3 ubiquitin transferase n=1 Tax=Thielaviopsis punctulata TaxID=72032 RepID=A0A0F4ZC38_9PEZI|nr:hypothetical protein TD95_002316 [Thielaviopsis punctulata]